MKDLIYKVKGCCLDIHRVLGPGLFEKVYQTALVYELRQSGFNIKTEVKIPIIYKGVKIDEGFRADIIVNDNLIVELKAIESINPIHHIQLKTYMALSGIPMGLLFNFNTANLFKDGIYSWHL